MSFGKQTTVITGRHSLQRLHYQIAHIIQCRTLGALRNITLKEFKNATISNEGVHMVIVKEHKTSSISGHRVICFMWKFEICCLAQVFHCQIQYLLVWLGGQCLHL